MKNRVNLFFILLILFSAVLHAQENPENIKQNFNDAVENAAEVINESGQNEIPDELLDLSNHPLNLNNDNLEILIRYNLISESQLVSLNDYRNKMGSLIELQELQQVDGFDKKTIQNIIPYCCITPSVKEAHTHQITFRIQNSLNIPVNDYPGTNSKILLRYRASLSSSLSISFTGEKDAGETSFTRDKKRFDFNSFNVCYKGKTILNKIIAGDFNKIGRAHV